MGLLAAYIAVSALVVSQVDDGVAAFLYFTLTGVAVLAGLLAAQRALRGRA
jgi:hypothetical protein